MIAVKRILPLVLSMALLLCGCQTGGDEPVHTTPPTTQTAPQEPAPAESESLSPVFTDWSVLTPYEPVEERYTRRHEEFTDRLTAADDYGLLLPYIGKQVWLTGYIDSPFLYGLITRDGEIVVDPVYTYVYHLSYGSDILPVLSLGHYGSGVDGQRHTVTVVAAADGRWVAEGDFRRVNAADGQTIVALSADGTLTALDMEGNTRCTFTPREMEFVTGLGFDWKAYAAAYDYGYFIDWVGGIGCLRVWSEEAPIAYIDVYAGEISVEPPSPMPEEPQWGYEQPEGFDDYVYVEPTTDPWDGTMYYLGYRNAGYDVMTRDGTILTRCGSIGYRTPWIWAGCVPFVDKTSFGYQDLEGNWVFRCKITGNGD